MALNWTMLSPNRTPVPLPGEMTVTTIDSPPAELTIIIPDAPPLPGSNATSGGSGGSKRHHVYGRITLTDQRFIFITHPPSSSQPVDTLSVPLHSILSTRFEQPTFAVNYLSFEVKPSPEGGLTDGTKVEVRFKDRAMFEFVSLLEKTRERVIYMRRQNAEEEENDGLPTYTMPAESSSVTMLGGVPVENPPGYDA